MSIANKKRGFRSIIVNDQDYHWHVSDNKDYIDVRIPSNRLCELHIYPLWVDPSILPKNRNCDNNLIVTPKLVQEAILFSIDHGWNQLSKQKTVFELKYDWKEFSIIHSSQ